MQLKDPELPMIILEQWVNFLAEKTLLKRLKWNEMTESWFEANYQGVSIILNGSESIGVFELEFRPGCTGYFSTAIDKLFKPQDVLWTKILGLHQLVKASLASPGNSRSNRRRADIEDLHRILMQ